MSAARVSPPTLAQLRAALVRHAFALPADAGDLGAAVAHLGFVQADPIRAPARAQDLVLRQRVRGYRAGDLERAYPALGLDEEWVYAHGFVPPATRALLHPRSGGPGAGAEPTGLRGEVLAFVRAHGPTHPRALADALGTARERNWWGGESRTTTRALDWLHRHGWLRVAHRALGVRVYAPAPPPTGDAPLAPEARLDALALVIARLFGALPEASFRGLLRLARHAVPDASGGAGTLARLRRAGRLADATVDGVRWLWPADAPPVAAEAPRTVRLLAPFDPLVWDRRRFALLWGWEYRFEAYTPAPRRRFGYYALPVLWGDRVVGWANVTTPAAPGEAPDVMVGYVAGRAPAGPGFARALEAEIARLRRFLTPRGARVP